MGDAADDLEHQENQSYCKRCGTTDMVGCTHLKHGWVCQFCRGHARQERAKTILGAISAASNSGLLTYATTSHNLISLKFGKSILKITPAKYLGELVLNVVVVNDEEADK